MIAVVRPAILLLLLTIPLWWWWRRRRMTPTVMTVSDATPFMAAARGRWRLMVPPALRGLALAAFIIAAAGPYRPGERASVRSEGIAIVIALDVSSSMLAEDFAPSNRLEVAKQQATAFVNARPNDRIGLVVFAGEALTQVPVTLDHAALDAAIAALEVGQLEDGTAIGSGLATSVARLRKVPGKEKVILLLSDGENNRGIIDPRTAGQTAEAFGIKVYSIGVGTEGEARVPTSSGLNGFRYEVLPVRIDEALLTEIAERTGGKYFRARDSEALARIFQQIDQLERSTVEVTRYARREEHTAAPIALGLLLLASELLIAGTLVVRVP